MVAVGCTGVIGSGKSTLCGYLAERGASVIDVDAVARGLTDRSGPAFGPIVERFGRGVLSPAGELDRPALARLVFSDRELRLALEAIVHPLVEAAVTAELARVGGPRAPGGSVAIVDHPLLVETDARRRLGLDGVLVVDVPYDLAQSRLVEGRGLDPADAARRIAAQATRGERLRAADFIVLNTGTLDELRQMADRAWAWLGTLGR